MCFSPSNTKRGWAPSQLLALLSQRDKNAFHKNVLRVDMMYQQQTNDVFKKYVIA